MLAPLAGCDDDVGFVLEPGRGIIEFFGDPVVVEIPGGVRVGEPFAVAVRTYGGGCTKQGTTRVSRSGNVATIEPFDVLHRPPDAVCPDVLLLFRHEAVLSFDRPGVVEIRVRGVRRYAVDGRVEEEPLVVIRTVTVVAS